MWLWRDYPLELRVGHHLVTSRPPAELGLELVDPQLSGKRPGHRSPSTASEPT